MNKKNVVTLNPWENLKSFTDARIALGRAGTSIPTTALLKFQLEHAQARDAVQLPLDCEAIYVQLKNELSACPQAPELFAAERPLILSSLANDRGTYLQRPDLGRLLNKVSVECLKNEKSEYDLAICIVDGLSSKAIEKNVSPFLLELLGLLKGEVNYAFSPILLVQQGRVAIGDDVAQQLGAKAVMVLIGERPGLISPDSMGMYLTYGAKVGCHDAMRNCISNIRPAGLSYKEAASKAVYLLRESRRLGFSGVNLKERTEKTNAVEVEEINFLTQQ